MCIKIVFQWRPYRGEGILATVVKFYFQQIQSNKKSLYIDSILHFLYVNLTWLKSRASGRFRRQTKYRRIRL